MRKKMIRQRFDPASDIGLWTVLILAAALAGAGCSGKAVVDSPSRSLEEKMASVGLACLTEREALIPASERGRYVPCRVIAGFPNPALPEHPAGYLIVGIEGRPSGSAEDLRRALSEAEPGQALKLVVRRNPYLDPMPEWWETKVTVLFPSTSSIPPRATPPPPGGPRRRG